MKKYFLLALLSTVAMAATPLPKPKLIVFLVIDQFRADYLMRFESRFLPAKQGAKLGGFEYLMNEGAYFPFGQYDIMQSMTAPGHATVLTGTYPYQAGIPLNVWYDFKSHELTYCVEDPTATLVGAPTVNPHGGSSPRNLLATTVGDELKNAGYPSRVVAVALKDRAAILMGGHRADLALWMDPDAHHWVSSKYYLPHGKLPTWVDHLNLDLKSHEGEKVKWQVGDHASGNSAKDSMAIASNAERIGGKNFPHSAIYGTKNALTLPLGLELTETAAEAALSNLKLGHGGATDLLAISFSSHDYLAHSFGLNSRELEEMTVAEDRVISKLINSIRTQMSGLKDVVFVLTADHGATPNPDLMKSVGIDAERLDEKELAATLSERLNQKFGKPARGQWVAPAEYNFFLDRKQIAEKGLDYAAMELEAKSALQAIPGSLYVFSATDYQNRKLPPGIFERQILHTYYPTRSGDLAYLLKPFYLEKGETAGHLTGNSYDRTVPIIIAGSQIKRGRYPTRAEVIDIAPTLSFITGTIPPILSEGRVLSEIFGH